MLAGLLLRCRRGYQAPAATRLCQTMPRTMCLLHRMSLFSLSSRAMIIPPLHRMIPDLLQHNRSYLASPRSKVIRESYFSSSSMDSWETKQAFKAFQLTYIVLFLLWWLRLMSSTLSYTQGIDQKGRSILQEMILAVGKPMGSQTLSCNKLIW